MPGPDPAHWLHRLTAEEWLAAAATEIAHAEAALARRAFRPGVTHARRAAGMAWNAVLTRHPDDLRHWPLVTYVSDVESAMAQAKQAAGDKNVLVHGSGIARIALAAGVLDEIELHVIPVLFGQGRRLFEGLAAEQIELERTRVLEGERGVTHVRYRVQR